MPRAKRPAIATEQDRFRNDLFKSFGAVLREVRQSTGLTQVAFAQRAGSERSFISVLENGYAQPSLLTIIKICRAANVEPVELMSRVMSRCAAEVPA